MLLWQKPVLPSLIAFYRWLNYNEVLGVWIRGVSFPPFSLPQLYPSCLSQKCPVWLRRYEVLRFLFLHIGRRRKKNIKRTLNVKKYVNQSSGYMSVYMYWMLACVHRGLICTEQWAQQTCAVNVVLEPVQQKHLLSISVRNNLRRPNQLPHQNFISRFLFWQRLDYTFCIQTLSPHFW